MAYPEAIDIRGKSIADSINDLPEEDAACGLVESDDSNWEEMGSSRRSLL